MELNLQLAKQIIDGAEKEAQNLDVKMVISVVDAGGNLIALHRMDDAWIGSVDIAEGKAWTSIAFKLETEILASLTIPEQELYGINTTNNGKIVVFGGGIPLLLDGKVIGAIGVSGSTVQNDMAVAKAGVKAFEDLLVTVK
ncbi:heme-binding protein [Lysinibacillus fusiformis]|nr:heme-binding protein [Lysinibacillus fusiformis]